MQSDFAEPVSSSGRMWSVRLATLTQEWNVSHPDKRYSDRCLSRTGKMCICYGTTQVGAFPVLFFGSEPLL